MLYRIGILAGCGLILAALMAAQNKSDAPQSDAVRELPGLLAPTRVFVGGSYLGVGLSDVDPDRARTLKLNDDRGVEIKDVSPGSPAEAAGLKPGDVLLTYNGENILGAQQLSRLVSETPAGRKVRVQYWRDGREQTATVTVAPRPEQRFDMNPRYPEINPPRMRDMQSDWQREMKRMMADTPLPIFAWKSSIGVIGEPVDAQLAQYFGVKQGVLVRSVESGSPADKAGIRAGDVITVVGDHPVNSAREITSSLRGARAGSKLTVMRNHKQVAVNIPADLPQ